MRDCVCGTVRIGTNTFQLFIEGVALAAEEPAPTMAITTSDTDALHLAQEGGEPPGLAVGDHTRGRYEIVRADRVGLPRTLHREDRGPTRCA
jgi:hypothetical protein